MNKEIVMKLREELRENILNRYDNPEYWSPEVIEDFIQEYQLNNEEAKALRNEINKEVK
jgi:hypothetical protein